MDKDEDELCVSIADDTEYVLSKTDERWTYESNRKYNYYILKSWNLNSATKKKQKS